MDRYDELDQLFRGWTPPSELAGPVPRQVTLSGGGWGMAILAGALVVGAVAAWIGLNRAVTSAAEFNRQLRVEGLGTEARVTRQWRDRSKERHPMVDYEFLWEGQTYTGRTRLPLHVWRETPVGATIAVRFLPSNPARNRARDWGSQPMPAWFPYIIAAGLMLLSVLLIAVIRRQMALLREGRAAPAVVTRFSKATHGKKKAHYEFRVLSGAVVKGKSMPTRWVPPLGVPLCVVYDRDDPGRSALYPMELAKVVEPARYSFGKRV